MKVALIQQKFHNTKSKNKTYTVAQIEEAKQNGADLIVLGELHQTHYFCQSEDVNNFDLANDFENDKIFWSKVALENQVVLVTSLFEKRAAGLYHNTAVVFDVDGSIAGIYRKMHIPDDPGFYEKFYFTPGDLGFEPIQTSLGKLGVLICWDQWYPEAARVMALRGAQILIYPTAIGWFDSDTKVEKQKQLDAWINVQKGHAIANNLPIITVNRVGFEKDSSGVLDGINFWGNSFILGSQGEVLQIANNSDEVILYQDINLDDNENVRRWWPFFRDRRVESYEGIGKRWGS